VTSVSDTFGGTVVHWNLAGWALNRGAPGVAQALARAVLAFDPLPVAVTANEVCSAQYEVLADVLGPAGYSAAAAWSIPEFGAAGCTSYGNVALWLGGNGGVEQFVYPDEAQIAGAATREKRTLLRVTSATLPLRIATTHPPPVAAVAAQQVRLAAAWLAERASGAPTVVAGDLNLVPWRSALDAFYRDHAEADRLPRALARPTQRGLRKLDYVFVPRAQMVIDGSISVAFRCRLSDHARIAARVAIRPASAGVQRRDGQST
jgi:endonuclease/exonuclease/phosphatase family metal-dependent hydrolase